MNRHQARFLCQLLLAGDVALSALAFALAFELRRWLPTTEAGAGLGSLAASTAYGPLMLGMLPLWALSFHLTGSGDVRMELRVAAKRHVRAVGLGLLLLVGAGFLLRLQFISRGFVLMLGVAQLVLLVGARALMLQVVRHRKVDHRVLVVGCDEAAVRFVEALRRQAWRQTLVGFVAVPGQPRLAAATPLVADLELEPLADLLDREPIDEVAFTVADRSSPAVREAIEACQTRGVDVLLAMKGVLPVHGHVELAELGVGSEPMLEISRASAGQGGPVAKRLIDVLVASVLLGLAAPVVLVAVLALRIESGAPALTRRSRAGRHGRRFTMLGLRCTSPRPVLEVDGREPPLTRVGMLVRAVGIDAVPQLLNVLAGDMSLVGPSAPRPVEVASYEPWQRRRLSVRPGITGLRPRGRNEAAELANQGMTLDLRYIDSWSLLLDLRILARALPGMASRSIAS
jgi:lipopolysaccharide/colanic/teichoic acid biosynthesis glycosyltransferase